VFEGLRGIVRGGTLDPGALALGLVLAGLYILLAAAFFGAVYRRAVRTGLIARYSAETLS
jgi:ABC-2 type transport system permease protein